MKMAMGLKSMKGKARNGALNKRQHLYQTSELYWTVHFRGSRDSGSGE